jgi:hypothetical protein
MINKMIVCHFKDYHQTKYIIDNDKHLVTTEFFPFIVGILTA